MSHRVDHNKEYFIEHLRERQWSQEDVDRWVHEIGHSALHTYASILTVLEDQQATDEATAERIQAEKDHDRVFCGIVELEKPEAAQMRNNPWLEYGYGLE